MTYVYIANARYSNHYKIGYSETPNIRTDSLKSVAPVYTGHGIDIIEKRPFVGGNTARYIKDRMHSRFREQRIYKTGFDTEWFLFDKESLAEAIIWLDVLYISERKEKQIKYTNEYLRGGFLYFPVSQIVSKTLDEIWAKYPDYPDCYKFNYAAKSDVELNKAREITKDFDDWARKERDLYKRKIEQAMQEAYLVKDLLDDGKTYVEIADRLHRYGYREVNGKFYTPASAKRIYDRSADT